MNAAEARKRRGSGTLLERVRQNPKRAKRIEKLVAQASVEHTLQQLMDIENVTPAELARRVKSKPPQISRELHGGLSRSTISRVAKLARALGYEFVPVFLPRNEPHDRESLLSCYGQILEKAEKARQCSERDPRKDKVAV